MTFEIVVVGTSLGGLSALRVLLSGLSSDFSLPLVIAQHRHKDSDSLLSKFLQQYVSLPLQEVEDKDEIRPGWVYLAPADYHLLVEPGYFSLSVDAPVCFARPSIDVLFESAVDTYHHRTVGIVLTGANQDGAQGLSRIKEAGGVAIVQEPASAENPVMPQAALDRTPVDVVLPLPSIAPYLMHLCSPVRR